MKPAYLLLAATAALSTACSGGQGNQSSSATGGSGPVQAVAPPQGGDWSQVVSKTPAGGFLMGNPNAAVKLVEYGSMTCGHCATFEEEGMQPLVDQYVKTGKVSFEFRNFVRDPYDLTAALVARCNGERGFFPLTEAVFKSQKDWMAKLQAATPEQQQALSSLGPDRQFLEIAKLMGFQQWAAQRGVPTAKSSQCLTNEAEINQLVQMNSDATTQFPQFPGTPSFTINGELQEQTASWEALEPKLREAVGG